MDAFKVILEALHAARGTLVFHVQSNQSRRPEQTIDELREILDSTCVNDALISLRNPRPK